MPVLFEFSTISPNGHDRYSSLQIFVESSYYLKYFLWSQITIKRYRQFWRDVIYFKTKYLKPCSGFKPIAHKVKNFPQKCVKGCPTVTTEN